MSISFLLPQQNRFNILGKTESLLRLDFLERIRKFYQENLENTFFPVRVYLSYLSIISDPLESRNPVDTRTRNPFHFSDLGETIHTSAKEGHRLIANFMRKQEKQKLRYLRRFQ